MRVFGLFRSSLRAAETHVPSKHTPTFTHSHANLLPLCVYKRSLSHFSLSSAVLLFSNFSGVIANWFELGKKNFASPPPSFSNKLEPEREKSRGRTEENGETMEKEGKIGGRSYERQGVASSQKITCVR